MTPKEALKRIEQHIEVHSKKEPFAHYINEALMIAVNALEKQMPKKPKKLKRFVGVCPTCSSIVEYPNIKAFDVFNDIPHCKWCGQAIDWSDTE